MNTIKRPRLLSIVCVIGFAWITFAFPSVFAPATKKISAIAPAIYGLIIAFTFIALIGIWHMKKWGVELYVTSFFLKQVFLLLAGDYEFSSGIGLVFSLVFILIFISKYKLMDRNL